MRRCPIHRRDSPCGLAKPIFPNDSANLFVCTPRRLRSPSRLCAVRPSSIALAGSLSWLHRIPARRAVPDDAGVVSNIHVMQTDSENASGNCIFCRVSQAARSIWGSAPPTSSPVSRCVTSLHSPSTILAVPILRAITTGCAALRVLGTRQERQRQLLSNRAGADGCGRCIARTFRTRHRRQLFIFRLWYRTAV